MGITIARFIVIGLLMISPALGQSDKRLFVEKRVEKLPGVYMTFVRFEKRAPSRGNEQFNVARIRLHNNMTIPIRFCGYDESISPIGEKGPNWELEKNPNVFDPKSRDNSSIPMGMIGTDECSVFTVKGGDFLDFSLVIDQYIPHTRIKIRFFYEWEDRYKASVGGEPQHFVYYYLRDLPEKK